MAPASFSLTRRGRSASFAARVRIVAIVFEGGAGVKRVISGFPGIAPLQRMTSSECSHAGLKIAKRARSFLKVIAQSVTRITKETAAVKSTMRLVEARGFAST